MDMDGGRPETGMNMDAGTSDMDMDMMMGGGMEMETMGFDMLMFPQPLDYGKLRLNRIGTIYLVVFCIWTTAFAIGWAVLIKYRKLPFIRLKNVPLVSWALAFLHLQLSFDILVYPLNGILPCRLEFWIMNICLPYELSPPVLEVSH